MYFSLSVYAFRFSWLCVKSSAFLFFFPFQHYYFCWCSTASYLDHHTWLLCFFHPPSPTNSSQLRIFNILFLQIVSQGYSKSFWRCRPSSLWFKGPTGLGWPWVITPLFFVRTARKSHAIATTRCNLEPSAPCFQITLPLTRIFHLMCPRCLICKVGFRIPSKRIIVKGND